jgi:nicotinamidase-related amidase
MALTSLDPKTALIVIDLQKGIVAMPTAHPASDIVHKASMLAEAFRQRDLPVVLVNVDGTPPGRTEQGLRLTDMPDGWTDLVGELNAHSRDHRVTKRTRGAFTNTDLDAYLKKNGVTQVVISGISTSAGVESTARFAQELGYHVTLPIDAMTDTSIETHTNSITRIFPRIGETGSTQDVLDLLAKRGA